MYQKNNVQRTDLLRENISESIADFAEKFHAENGFKLAFEPAAKEKIISLCVARDKDAQTICSELFRDYSHGLAIVARNTGAEEFSIPKEAVENPDKFLSELVVNSFKK